MKALLIDLDDTLYSEWSYVYSGYKHVAELIAKRNGLDENLVFNRMLYQYNKYGRIGLFDEVKKYVGVDAPSTKYLVDIYRGHYPFLCWYYGAIMDLENLRGKFKIAVVTDGHPESQRRKAEALDLKDNVDEIVYCMDTNHPKPASEPYLEAANRLGVDIKDAVIIGDDPYCDMVAASILDIKSYRVLTGKYANIKSIPYAMPEKEFKTFFDLTQYLLGNY